MAEASNEKNEGGPQVLKQEIPEDEPQETGIELGDFIHIKGGRLDGAKGKLYGIYEDRFTLLPFGVTDRVVHVPLVEGEPDPDYGVDEIEFSTNKDKLPGFVNLADMRAGSIAETFGSNGEPTGTFQIIAVNEEEDSATLLDEAGSETKIVFGFAGIPRDTGYEVIRTREKPVEAPPEQKEEVKEVYVPPGSVEEEDLAVGEGVGEEGGEEQKQIIQEDQFAIGEEIELENIQEIKEISEASRIFPDVYQRSEMLAQLIRRLPESQQRNPIQLQRVRRDVEVMMHMRNGVVDYAETGEPRGTKRTSVANLAELVNRPNIPLTRKVVPMKKVLFIDHSVEANGKLNPEKDVPVGDYVTETGELTDFSIKYLADTIREAERLEELADMETGAPVISEIPKFYTDLKTYSQKVQQSHIITPGETVLTHDEEIFRGEIPSMSSPPVSVLDKTGDDDIVNPPPSLIQTGYSVTRLLKNREARVKKGEPSRTIEPADSFDYDTIMVFPLHTLRDIGPIRSGYLVKDVALGMTPMTPMKEIMEENEVDEYPTSKTIFPVGLNGVTGNISVAEWLKLNNFFVKGVGDIYSQLQGYGTKNIEWNVEQQSVIQEKVEQAIASLRIFLAKQREENKARLENLRFEPQPLLDATELKSRIEGEPILQDVLQIIQEYMGDLANVDINWFTYVFINYQDLTLAVLGQQANIIARERLRNVRGQYLQALEKGYRLKMLDKQKGEIPTINKCPHMKELEMVKKVEVKSDEAKDLTAMKLFLKVLEKYRGKIENDWINCNVCKKHFVCAHELLQSREFLKPKEKEAIHKDLLLKFSGGSFAGKFICRVCGQGIQDLDFDTSIEFDDEGRPMMGRSVMVDDDAIEQEKIDGLLAGPADKEEEINFGTEELNLMYKTLQTISSKVGISPEENDYKQMIEQFSSYTSTLPTREVYIRATAGKKVQDYDVYYSSRYIAAAATILLLNIQTRVPDYVVVYTSGNCRNGFFGWPLEDISNLTGIQCISATVASIDDKTFPWENTGLQKTSDYVKRTTQLTPFIQKQMEEFIKNPVTQAALKKKRDYQQKMFGYAGSGKTDAISKTFRPIPYKVSEEEAAQDVIIAAAATPIKKASAWIQLAHGIAKQSAPLNPDSPFSDITCCLHSLYSPDEFWKSKSANLPALDSKVAGQVKYRSGTATTLATIKEIEQINGKTNPEEYYKLFVKVCYRGDFIGEPHEFGLGDHPICANCGLSLTQSPKIQATLEINPPGTGFLSSKDISKAEQEAKEKIQQTIKTQIESSGIDINEKSFNELLMKTRQKNAITTDKRPLIPRKDNTFTQLSTLENPPFKDWVAVLKQLQVTMNELGASPDTPQILRALEVLATQVRDIETGIKTHVKEGLFRVIDSIARKESRDVGEILTTYLLTPYQRWMSGVKREQFVILKSYELAEITTKDILERGLGNHLDIIGGGQPVHGIVARKIKYFIKMLSEYCKKVFPVLRDVLTPGGRIVNDFLIRSLVMGAVGQLLDPNSIPEGEDDIELGAAPNIKLIYESLAQALNKYAKGSFIPSEEEIRIQIEQRQEAENQVFVTKLDRMSKEDRQVELLKKKLGLGEWALGGTKSIREYDKDIYELERERRAAMGIPDYAEGGQGGIPQMVENIDDAGNDVGEQDFGDYD